MKIKQIFYITKFFVSRFPPGTN